MRTAIVVRLEDGVFQPMLLQLSTARDVSTMYRLAGCVLRRIGPGTDGPPIITLPNGNEDVFVFVNVPLETVNHMFLESLIVLALREKVGIGSGILIDEEQRILSSGFDLTPTGECQDSFAGRFLRSLTFKEARQVTSLSPYFFVVRRQLLLAAGGLGILSSRRMPELLQRLLATSRNLGLQCWVTPNAVATMAGPLPFPFPENESPS